jgi:predicted Zn-ribbon and HTH transcriptional regulator
LHFFKKDGDRKISPEMLTRREKIKKILQEDRFTDIDELILELEIHDKRILINDLQHIERSLKRLHQKLIMKPAQCQECGFIFDKKRIKYPSKCPKCKGQRILSPQFKIK